MGRRGMSWAAVRRLIESMFTNDYGGMKATKLHFYGNDGVCLFKYFVTPEDPQWMYTAIVLSINIASFGVITTCYIFIHFLSVTSAKSTSMAKPKGKRSVASQNLIKRNTALQRKVSLIICTDFLCWIPFVCVSLLHYLRVFDASPWYAIFSIVILPINSVINPMLYDNFLQELLKKMKDLAAARQDGGFGQTNKSYDEHCMSMETQI
jgi:hypothetical protein